MMWKRRSEMTDKETPRPSVSAGSESLGSPKGGERVSPARPLQPASAANLVGIVAAAAGVNLIVVDESTLQLWMSDTEDMTVTLSIEADSDPDAVGVYCVRADWHSNLDDVKSIELHTILNAWNDSRIAPRVFEHQDINGHTHVRGELILTSYQGLSIAQLDEWVRLSLAAVHSLHTYLHQNWPHTATVPTEFDVPDSPVVIEAYDATVADTEDKLAQFVTRDNPFGLLGGAATPVSLDRIADMFAASFGQRPPVQFIDEHGNGTVPIGWDDVAIDVSLHGPVLTVSASADFGVHSPEALEYLLTVCNRWSTNRAGMVSVLRGFDTPDDAVAPGTGATNDRRDAVVMTALHLLVDTGMSDDQLESAVKYTCTIMADSFAAMVSEITS